jgi:hypothetical protein
MPTPRKPRREPHPAKDGTPWYLRTDLTKGEVRDLTLTPEQKKERTNARHRRLYAADLDKSRKASREKAAGYYAADPHKFRDKARRDLEANPDKLRSRKRRVMTLATLRERGLTPEVHDYMTIRQLNLCDICKEPETAKSKAGGAKRLAIDHNHSTNRPRDLLCMNCNNGLGKFKDNPALLRTAADYLDRHAQDARLSPAIARMLAIPTND